MKYAVLGFGNRGYGYSQHMKNDGRAQMVAVCEKNAGRKETAVREFGISPDMFFTDETEFFAKGKLCDLLIISTQDTDHYGHALQALEVGYDLLLEKPIAETYEKCRAIYDKAEEKGCRVFVCHVLRYAPLFRTVKEELATGKYGEVMTINLTENVEFHHQCHSYVRGNWAVCEASTPMIIAKCCHDTDMISWWMGHKPCVSVSSYGDLTYFNKEHAPEGATKYCFECPHKMTCPASAITIYGKHPEWLRPCVSDYRLLENRAFVDDLMRDKSNPYARCVFHCDNTAVDHQVVNMQFAGGATAHLTMTAFSTNGGRDFHIHCTNGDIIAFNNTLYLKTYGDTFEEGEVRTVDIGALIEGQYGHGGGDSRMIRDMIDIFENNGGSELTTIGVSLQSHAIGFAAEESRKAGGKAIVPDCVI